MKRYLSKLAVSNSKLTLIFSLFIAAALNMAVYSDIYKILAKLDDFSIGFVITIPIFFTLAFNLLFNVISWPYLTKPLFIVLVILSSFLSYAEYNYGVIFDRSMIRNLFETNSSEATSYFSSYVLLWVIILGVIPAVIIALIHIKHESILKFSLKKLLSMILSVVGILLIAYFYYQDYSSVIRNHKVLEKRVVPSAFLHNSYRYLRDAYFSEPIAYRKLGEDAHQSQQALLAATEKPTIFVFLVGETARAQNYSFNGYARQTTPYTQNLKNRVVFKDFASCGTSTAVSVPCMFSQMNRTNFDRDHADRQDNALDILSRAKVDILWKDNDGGDKRVAQRVKLEELNTDVSLPHCNGHVCNDLALIEHLKDDIQSMHGNRMILLHMIGSHGPTYFWRYPKAFAFYKPNCNQADIENCSVKEITNTYDNSLRFSDFVLKQTIDQLSALSSDYNVAVMYMSDHGESLGESGLFLHGTSYQFAPDFQKRVPMIMWFSDGFMSAKHLDLSCMRKQGSRGGFSQDYIFDSLLGIMDVKSKVYRPKQDLFAACRT
ncbi:phosphoethanolamine transferase [Celerinatantimonas sp. MCCC 1A17872]|uniref:phosphoethanolamine transferase n=1 Tax=Celerinatantimonas sp. MCCC 1A17872 TaxID=3177514 RepID=UPI0038C87660